MDSGQVVREADSAAVRRYWCPREGRIAFDEWGFVADPESWLGKAENQDLREFSELEPKRCLILLGEAGIGKSHTLSQIVTDLASRIDPDFDQLAWFDLSEYGDEGRLVDELFRENRWAEWQQSGRRLKFVIDSFDECHDRIPTLPTILASQLKRLPVACLERLYLRIACRTAPWPSSLEESLRATFGDANVGVFELAPLRRKDVESIAGSNGIDGPAFVREVVDTSAVPFAIKPVTLNFLVGLVKQGDRLPSSIRELYLDGCRRLCQEPRNRGDSGASGKLNADQRLDHAGWIAACLFFGNKVAVATHPDAGTVEALQLSDLAPTGFPAPTGNVDITEDGIREALQTGLFTARGKDLLGPAHNSYAEFLVAEIMSPLDPDRALDLLRHPGDPDRKTAAHLRGVVAWLASVRLEIFEDLLQTDPWLLLHADVGNADSRMKTRLVDRLLESSGVEAGLDLHRMPDGQLRQLKHERLGEQLLTFILQKDAP